MKKIMAANDVFEVEKALDVVMEEHLKLPLNLALKLVKIKREVSETASYIASRVVEIIPKIGGAGVNELTDQEKFLYSGVMASQVEVDTHGLAESDFSDIADVLVELGVAEKIALLF